MPALKLKTAGSKPAATRKSTAKPAAKPAPKRAVKAAAKTSVKKGTTAKRTGTKPKQTEEVVDRRTARGKVDPDVLSRYEDGLVEVGQRMDEAQQMRDQALNDAYEITQSALADGVPMALVSELTGISRQWLYNMGNHGGRGGSVTQGRRNGSTPKRKTSTARKTGTTARKATAKKTGTRKPAGKAASGAKKLSIKRA